ELKRKGNKVFFHPVNVKETTFINSRYPEKEKTLNNLEEKIFILSTGTLSIEGIILKVTKEFEKLYEEKYVRKKATIFFKGAFLKNWAIGFAKSWQ
ncbi:MAG: hypothetical protein KKD11_00650, partial [Candidatus Omnitrophica bacterium]|nr:hypothetical protein [Candidatus Omnitrophota bacterium]